MAVAEYDNSLSDFVERARTAFDKWIGPTNGEAVMSWVTDVFEDRVIVRQGEQYFRVPMTVTDDAITFAPQGEWEPVRLSYVAEMSGDFEPIAETVVSEFKADDAPSVPTAPGVDMTALTEGDDKPFFLTIPLAPDGTVSKNGLLYDADLGESIVEQIMAEKPGGIMGHIPTNALATAFPVSQAHWIGAMRANDQTWIKGYIPRTFPEVREEYRIEKAKGGKAATSIFGKAIHEFQDQNRTVWRAKHFKLDRIDLAPYNRAAAPGSGTFAITSEMEDSHESSNDERELNMPDRKDLLAELTAEDIQALPVFQTVRETIIAEYQANADTEKQIAELTADNETKTTRIEELEAEQKADRLLIQEFQTKQFDADLDAKIAELTAWNVTSDEGKEALGSLRGAIKNMALAKLGTVREMDQAQTVLDDLLGTDLKPLVEMTRDRLSGPPVTVPGDDNRPGNNGATLSVEDTPDTRKDAASKFAFKKG
jgi:hypothetical protein